MRQYVQAATQGSAKTEIGIINVVIETLDIEIKADEIAFNLQDDVT